MKTSFKLPELDFERIQDDFRRLSVTDVGSWAPIPKITILIGIFAGVLFLAWLLMWGEQIETLDAKKEELEHLKQDYVAKKKQAINVDIYTQQLNEVDRSFGALLKQLPNKAEMESLLVDVNQAGLGRGLQFELFKPGPEAPKEFYAEVPINVKLSGTYHDLGAFAADIAKLPRIVTLNNLSVQSPAGGGASTSGALTIEMVVKTFRYLDDDEVKALKKPTGAGK